MSFGGLTARCSMVPLVQPRIHMQFIQIVSCYCGPGQSLRSSSCLSVFPPLLCRLKVNLNLKCIQCSPPPTQARTSSVIVIVSLVKRDLGTHETNYNWQLKSGKSTPLLTGISIINHLLKPYESNDHFQLIKCQVLCVLCTVCCILLLVPCPCPVPVTNIASVVAVTVRSQR